MTQEDELVLVSDLQLSITEEIPIMVSKEFDTKSHVKGYHAYMNEWKPFDGEVLKTRPELENAVDKYAVAVVKDTHDVGHLKKGKNGRFAKTIFYFLRANQLNIADVTVKGRDRTMETERDCKFLARLNLREKQNILRF